MSDEYEIENNDEKTIEEKERNERTIKEKEMPEREMIEFKSAVVIQKAFRKFLKTKAQNENTN